MKTLSAFCFLLSALVCAGQNYSVFFWKDMSASSPDRLAGAPDFYPVSWMTFHIGTNTNPGASPRVLLNTAQFQSAISTNSAAWELAHSNVVFQVSLAESNLVYLVSPEFQLKDSTNNIRDLIYSKIAAASNQLYNAITSKTEQSDFLNLSNQAVTALAGKATTNATDTSRSSLQFSGNTMNATIAANTTWFTRLSGWPTNATSDTTLFTREILAATTLFTNFYVKVSAAAGSGKTDTVTLLTNGVSTGFTVTVAGTTQTSGTNAVGSAWAFAGSEIGVSLNVPSAGTASKFSWAVEGIRTNSVILGQ